MISVTESGLLGCVRNLSRGERLSTVKFRGDSVAVESGLVSVTTFCRGTTCCQHVSLYIMGAACEK